MRPRRACGPPRRPRWLQAQADYPVPEPSGPVGLGPEGGPGDDSGGGPTGPTGPSGGPGPGPLALGDVNGDTKLDVVVKEPLAVVTVIGPEVAPCGTLTQTLWPDVDVTSVAGTPLNVTDVAPSR